MSENFWIAIFALIGTLAGSVSGILIANKLVNYRIEQLEKKLDKYTDNQDDIKMRLIKVEGTAESAHLRIDDVVQQLNITERRKKA